MLTCRKADALIVREVDGDLGPGERADLSSHAAACEQCRNRRAANAAVRRVLAARPEADVPPGFAAHVSAQLEPAAPGDWLSSVDWRRWTEWTLPVAAGLVLVVGFAAGGVATTSQAPATATESTATTETWSLATDADADAEVPALAHDVSSEELLASMLGTEVKKPAEGERDGR